MKIKFDGTVFAVYIIVIFLSFIVTYFFEDFIYETLGRVIAISLIQTLGTFLLIFFIFNFRSIIKPKKSAINE